jgi:hypothetical protein
MVMGPVVMPSATTGNSGLPLLIWFFVVAVFIVPLI